MGLKKIIEKATFVDIIKGLSVTGKYFVSSKVTVEYPKEKLVEKTLFIIFAALAIGGALGVITRKNIVHALILLIFTFLNVAAIFILTEAFFLAVLQVLVYAGAIMVLFTFVIMFLNLREFAEMEQLHPTQKWAALILAPIMLAEFVYVFVSASFSSVGGDWTPEAIASAGGNVKAMGITLFNDMLLPFEVAGLMLLAAMVGAIVLGRKEEEECVSLGSWDSAGQQAERNVLEQEV